MLALWAKCFSLSLFFSHFCHFHPSDATNHRIMIITVALDSIHINAFLLSHSSHSQTVVRSDMVVFSKGTTREKKANKANKCHFSPYAYESVHEVLMMLITAKKGERNYYYLCLVHSSIYVRTDRMSTYIYIEYGNKMVLLLLLLMLLLLF